MTSEPSRLLIMACSQRKRPDPGLLPAIERYDGPMFSVLHRFLRERQSDNQQLDIFILSAAYGLIAAEYLIPNYDQIMTSQGVVELRDQVLTTFTTLIEKKYSNLCLAMSKKYLSALDGWESLVPSSMSVTITNGSQGIKLAQLRNWLWGERSAPIKREQKVLKPSGVARLRGMEIRLTSTEVLDRGRMALDEDGVNANHFRDWYVEIDDQRVALKWLVSKLTGLPVSAFTTGEARRVLNSLGIQTYKACGEVEG